MAKKVAKKPSVKAAAAKARRPAAGRTSGEAIDDVKKLVRLMVDNDLSELNLEEGQRKIFLKRGGVSAPPAGLVTQVHAAMPAPALAPAQRQEAPVAAEEFIEIKSPMVGTFYGASSPDTEPFCSVGDFVEEDDVVCIVEAMKVMNEIKSECTGTVVEMCVKNAQPVEFGQVLFKVRPG